MPIAGLEVGLPASFDEVDAVSRSAAASTTAGITDVDAIGAVRSLVDG